MFNVKKIRKDFPILKRKVNKKPLIYLDNTATTQKPKQVIQSLVDFYSNYNANVHRGLHTLSEESSEAYEQAHAKVGNFIHAKFSKEIVFTRNTTESLNLLAYSLYRTHLSKGDEVLISQMEHHSNLVPWLYLSKKLGFKLNYIQVTPNGLLDLNSLQNLLTPKTKIVSLTHASNVLGTINPIQEIGKTVHDNNSLFIVDAAQSVPHFPVNVQKLNCDFLAFSGHKMLAPTGIGVLYGKEDLLNDLEPFLLGGDMISEVFFDSVTFNEVPWKFEAGTSNIGDGIALGTAVDYLSKLGMENVQKHEQELTQYAWNQMQDLEGIQLYGPKPKYRTGVISFNLKGIHPHDIASLMDQEGIAIRSGDHCAQPLMRELKISGSARASFYVYNTKQEIDRFIFVLKNTIQMFKKK
ncbi:MAG: cysteine desulfurase [Candidatus Diapherotrites archaeon]|nr:cysteine desulfurase [Candidatus Diapherotrites archaeon]